MNKNSNKNSNKKGKLFVVSAPSGAGKSSLIKALITQDKNACTSISHTTRDKRVGEVDKQHYYFIDDVEFDSLIKQDVFLEWANVFNYKYGTSKQAINDMLNSGYDVFLDIDWQGARQVKKLYQNAVLIFILPPSLDVLQERLEKRGDDAKLISYRMNKAISEISHKDEFDHIIINDDFGRSLRELQDIMYQARL